MGRTQHHFVGFVIAGRPGTIRQLEAPRKRWIGLLSIRLDTRRSRDLERGKFDACFLIDYMMLFDTFGGGFRPIYRGLGSQCMLEPTQLHRAMARVTSKIGLAATMSTTFYHPFHIARTFATLDHISHGRAGWNVVNIVNGERSQELRHGQPAGQIPQVRSGR